MRSSGWHDIHRKVGIAFLGDIMTGKIRIEQRVTPTRTQSPC